MPIEPHPRIEKSGSFNYYQPKEFFGQQPSLQYGAPNNGFSPAAPSHEFEDIQCPSSMRKMQSACMTSEHFQNEEYASPLTKSTEASSDDGGMSADCDSKFNPFQQLGAPGSLSRKCSKTENGWKRKVKTELCKFWLNGMACENQLKEQGCGFAHG